MIHVSNHFEAKTTTCLIWSSPGVPTNIEFKEYQFFEFKHDFRDKFAKSWFEYFKCFKIYRI